MHFAKHNENVRRNRAILKRLINATIFLGRQELAFRGHNESEDLANKGNYRELTEAFYDTCIYLPISSILDFSGFKKYSNNPVPPCCKLRAALVMYRTLSRRHLGIAPPLCNRLCDCTQTRLQLSVGYTPHHCKLHAVTGCVTASSPDWTHSSVPLVFEALSTLASTSLVPSGPLCLSVSVPRRSGTFSIIGLDTFGAFSAPVLHSFGASALLSSVHRRPRCPGTSASSVPQGFDAFMHRYLRCPRPPVPQSLGASTPSMPHGLDALVHGRPLCLSASCICALTAFGAPVPYSLEASPLCASPLELTAAQALLQGAASGQGTRGRRKARWRIKYLVRQQAIAPALAPAPPLAPVPEPIPSSLAVDQVSSEQDEAISIKASWDGELIVRPEVQETAQEADPSSEVAAEADVTPPLKLSSGAHGASLQIPPGSLGGRA
ncbi:UNVERIFIED_CONTAM: hypothetical protein FKN15_069261 [Acipenser sinensis]